MKLTDEVATVQIEFDPSALLKEVVIDLVDDTEVGGTLVAKAILDGIEQLFAEEQVEVLDAILLELLEAANEMREDDEVP